MTANKIMKNDLVNEIQKININNLLTNTESVYKEILDLKMVIESEMQCSLKLDEISIGENLIKRNVVCLNNAIYKMMIGDYVDSWWEISDILDFKKDDGYISENEISIIWVALNSFANCIKNNLL